LNRRHLLWLLIPALGLVELGAHAYFAKRAPRIDDWRAAAPSVRELRRAGEPVVVAPAWAEPLARQAFGDELMPLAHVARPDMSGFARAIEVSAMGERSIELASWRVAEERSFGRFRLRVLENPKPHSITFDFVERLVPAQVEVFDAPGRPCRYNPNAATVSGGLGGHPTFPVKRFECSGAQHVVAVTVIDDEDYRARRCIWAPPSPAGPVTLRFRGVALGDRIHGYTGMPWVLARDGVGGTVDLEARVAGESIGRATHPDQRAWVAFDLATGRHAGTTADVELVVTAQVAQNRPFCFYADTRWTSPR
jgi:hypothetical protein